MNNNMHTLLGVEGSQNYIHLVLIKSDGTVFTTRNELDKLEYISLRISCDLRLWRNPSLIISVTFHPNCISVHEILTEQGKGRVGPQIHGNICKSNGRLSYIASCPAIRIFSFIMFYYRAMTDAAVPLESYLWLINHFS